MGGSDEDRGRSRRPGLMAPWPLHQTFCAETCCHMYYLKCIVTYFLVTTCTDSFVIVVGRSKCDKLFF
jgi:hypothetical protein